MKSRHFFLLLLIPVLLAGCETLTRHDRAVLRSHEVSPDVYAKMVNSEPLSPGDVIDLSKRDVPAELIIHYMDETDCVYHLRKVDVDHLRSAGVSDEVISYMLSTAPPYGPAVYRGGYAYPPPYPYPYAYPYGPYGYYPDAYAGPVVVVGGYGYRGWGGGWGWHHGGGWDGYRH